jgi:hypothetical protein
MTKTILTLAAALFTTSAAASDVYHGLAKGNSDLFDAHPEQSAVVGVQPGVGDRIDIYGPLGRGNTDLFKTVQGSGDSDPRPDIYQGFRGNPDLRF